MVMLILLCVCIYVVWVLGLTVVVGGWMSLPTDRSSARPHNSTTNDDGTIIETHNIHRRPSTRA